MPQMLHGSWYEKKRKAMMKDEVPDCVFPTDNEFGIPMLRADYMANAVDLPVVQWGQRRRTDYMFGTWGFYVDDYRFQALWKDPTPLVNSGCNNTFEANFSVHDQLPRAVGLYHIYRKRWLSRFWQEFGSIRIFVDLNVGLLFKEDNMLGVPKGWTAYCTRGYADQVDAIDDQYETACKWAGEEKVNDILFVVYGGGKNIKEHCLGKPILWLPDQLDHYKKSVNTEGVQNLQGDERPMSMVFEFDGMESHSPRRKHKDHSKRKLEKFRIELADEKEGSSGYGDVIAKVKGILDWRKENSISTEEEWLQPMLPKQAESDELALNVDTDKAI